MVKLRGGALAGLGLLRADELSAGSLPMTTSSSSSTDGVADDGGGPPPMLSLPEGGLLV